MPPTEFTVVGLYDDNQQVWVEHIVAEDAGEAVINAGRKLLKREGNEDMDPENLLIVSVFHGHLYDKNENSAVVSIVDFPGWEE